MTVSILESQIDALSKDISQVVAVLPKEAEAEDLRVADVTANSMEACERQTVRFREAFSILK